MSRKEDFPISYEQVNSFIKENEKQWKKTFRNKKWIIVNFSMVRLQAAWIIPKLIYARGMADKCDANVAVFTWRENDELSKLVESFGFSHIVIDTTIRKKVSVTCRAIFKTLHFYITDGTGDGLRNLKIDGITAGMSIYEDILRTSELSTIRTARDKIVIKKMIHILSFYYLIDKFAKENQIVGALMDDVAYHEGLIIKLLNKKTDAIIMKMNNVEKRKIVMDPIDKPQTVSLYMKKYIDGNIKGINVHDAIDWTDKYLQERFQGKNGREIDRGAFENKRVLNREEFNKFLNLEDNKKNVVIMAHTFTDAVFNYGDYYFRDYYDWMEKTLTIASTIDKVNWILKPHPTRKAYNESNDSIEDMFKRICGGHKNMHILSDEISSETIANAADVQITIGGNSGAEYSCFGIPAVIVGKPYYAGYGYTIEPKSFVDYKKILEKIDKIEKLDSEQIEKAKCIFYLRNNEASAKHYYKFVDEFAMMNNGSYKAMIEKMAVDYFESNKGTIEYNSAILKEITEYYKIHDMTKCDYYKMGFADMDGINI